MGVLYPLDQIKTIMQVERQASTGDGAKDESESTVKPKKPQSQNFWVQALAILKEQKWRVYQGHVSTQIALGGSNFVYFFCYNGLKAGLLKRLRQMDPKRYPANSDVISPIQNLVLSCVAGIINVYATAPLWVANMRLKSKDHAKYNGVIDCMRKIVDKEGLLSLWNGTLASLILVSNPVIHYVSYERMKTAIQLHRQRLSQSTSLSAWEIFVLGALAKSLTTVVTYPLQVAQSIIRVQSKKASDSDKSANDAKPVPGVVGCLTQIYRDEGLPGWFAGLEAKLLQTVLTAAISLVTYEKLLAMILFFLKPTKPALAIKSQA
ncbi:hypothetical protein Poli38472_000210 [Pythium oligandrum]|uniref:Uncharacterized protein n=1 Tax=Pythium oligandrum TaxID=41045 RepID=A0A8K1CBW8_PYTOL|nr:hypothetical protein Poli38472_000210 [Pythium oligandrum]|eukprot:TMW60168.1 hypothetical protein Poli38472_000210 [Pythium oligandrum]